MRHRILFTVLGAVAGALLGLACFYLLYGKAEYITVIDVGSRGQIDNPASSKISVPGVLDYVQSLEFAKLVAEDAGNAALIYSLPAHRFGGSGGITIRQIRPGNVIELRVAADTRDQAQVAATSAANVLVEMASAAQQGLEAEAVQDNPLDVRNSIIQRIQTELADGNAQSAALLLDALNDADWAKVRIEPALSRPTIIVEPATNISLIGSPIRMAVIGGLVGLLFGMFFSIAIDRRQAGDSSADLRK